MASESTLSSPFLDRTLGEATAMLIEARAYFTTDLRREAQLFDGRHRVILVSHQLRVTSRLAEVVAWLMFRKAVNAGELTEREYRERSGRLEDIRVCMETGPVDVVEVPGGLKDFLVRSRQLYLRVARLDRLVRHPDATAPTHH